MALEERGKRDFAESELGRTDNLKPVTHRTRASVREIKEQKKPKVSRMQSIKGVLLSGNYLQRESNEYAKKYGKPKESGGHNSTPVFEMPPSFYVRAPKY